MQTLWQIFIENYREILLWGAIMLSLVIGIIGAIKPLLFNRIKNEELRRFALSISNTVGSFASTAICFAYKHLDWSKYIVASIIFSICCILVYHLYETIPYLKKGIDALCRKIFGHLYDIGILVVKGAPKAQIDAKIAELANEFKQTAKHQIKASKSSKKDKELENL